MTNRVKCVIVIRGRGKIMPSNDININNGLHYIVQDTDMDELMAWLDKHNIGVDCTGSEDDEATA